MTTRPSVLLADGMSQNADTILHLLEGIGVELAIAADVNHLLTLAKESQPAVILLSSTFGKDQGYQALNQLRSAPSTRHLPVIFMPSSLAEKPMSLHRELLESTQILPKPVDPKRLRGMVQFFERLYALRQEIAGLGGDNKSTLIESEDEGVIAVDSEGRIRFLNATAERLLYLKVTDSFGQYVESIFEDDNSDVAPHWHDHPVTKIISTDQILQVDRARFWRKDGVQIDVKFAAIPVNDIENVAVVIAFRLLKKSREDSDKLKTLSNVDALTGLPSRNRIEEALDVIVAQSKSSSQHSAVLFIDIDHFRHINEALSHDHGDELLKLVAERIRLLIRRDDAIGRMESDEFVVVLTTLDQPQGAATVAQKIVEKIREPFLLSGHEIYTGCSVGVAVYPSCGDDPKLLITHAEVAMERAKLLGRNNFQFFTDGMNAQRHKLLEFEHEIHRAWNQGEFNAELVCHSDCEFTHCIAYEACLRWNHPEKGLLDQHYFGSVADESGLGLEMAKMLWQQACGDFALRQSESADANRGFAQQLILPLSASLFALEDLQSWINNVIHQHGLQPTQIMLAIPDAVFAMRGTDFERILRNIQIDGFRFMLDQFATGYASLEMLRHLSYEAVKLSDLLVARVGLSRTDEAVVDAAIYLAHNLGLKVYANGVDKPCQLAFLKERQCEWIQGQQVESHFMPDLCDGNDRSSDSLSK